MDHEVAEAIPGLVDKGILPASVANHLLRIAKNELVSLHSELRVMLYVGVMLVTAGVGILVKDNLANIGPLTIAVGIGLAAMLCFAWVLRQAPPFSWQAQESTHPAFDYLLLLGALLVAAELAYIEVKFTPLGANWSWHLLVVATFMAALAVRYDSRVLFSLGLSTFAAWRGVSLSNFTQSSWRILDPQLMWWNAIGCGALFVGLGFLLKKFDRKAHFEPVAVNLGWLLILAGLISGAVASEIYWWTYALLLLSVSLTLTVWEYRARQMALFAMGVIAAYIGVSRIVFHALKNTSDEAHLLWFSASAIALVVGLFVASRRMGHKR